VSIEDVVASLRGRNARDEALGVWQPRRWREPAIVPSGRAWRLGTLLLDGDGRLYDVGNVTRAITPKDFNSDKTVAGDERREWQRAAVRGRFASGETVNHGFAPVTDVEAQQLVGATPLEEYLIDRAKLLPSTRL
jgi:hypothetical protein